MMTRTYILLISLLSVLLASCGGGKVAEQYATKMGEILKTYRNRVEAKIQVEQQSYVDLAAIYDKGETDRIQDQLDTSRNSQTLAFADRIQKDTQGKPSGEKQVFLSDVRATLQRFAAEDFNQGARLLTREMDAYKKSLQDLDDLAVDQANLSRLQDQLASLARPNNTVDQLRSLAEFGCDVNRNYRLLEVDRELKALAARIDSEKNPDKKTSLTKQKTALDDEKKQLATPCKV